MDRRALAGRLIAPKAILLMIAAYCLIHYLIRLGLSPVYTLDEAEQVLLSEVWRMGYRFRHPPLMTWIYAGVEDVFGLHRWSFHAVKYILLAGGLSAFYFAARRILASGLDAALALAGLALVFVMAAGFHIDLTHSVLMTVLVFANLHAFVRAVQRGGWSDWVYFGTTLGLGALSKYAFLLAPAGLLLGLALTPYLRARINPIRLGVSLLLGLLIVAPYLGWSAQSGHSFAALTSDVVGADPQNFLVGWAAGTGSLIWALFLAACPLLPVFLVLFPQTLRRGKREGSRAAWRRLLLVAVAAGAGLALAGVFLLGAGDFKPRWFYSVIAPLPLVLMLSARLGGAASANRDAALAVLAAVSVAGVMIYRVALDIGQPMACQPECRTEQPVAAWAQDLREAGFAGGTILTNDYHLAGNLRAAMPEARLISSQFPRRAYARPAGEGQCLIVWNTLNLHLKDAMFDYAESQLGAGPASREPEGTFIHPIAGNEAYLMALNYRFAEPAEQCR
ncbi:ArnT family glycosyltransferase [Euryhalocaulis caribicus]|uniref:ArnT family glycosyltransferase n=1 Tax=Euryhalocaulis caribicus TaxID=1161401 RepID=UPI0003AB43DF|nr:glycosyltransferase family 39 protein [Euryhalocaulis caribicus]